MLKSKGETCMVEEPTHVKQLSLNHVCKIGLKPYTQRIMCLKGAQAWPSRERIFFTQIRPIWLGDLGTGEKNVFHLWLGPIFAILYFLANAEHTLKIM